MQQLCSLLLPASTGLAQASELQVQQHPLWPSPPVCWVEASSLCRHQAKLYSIDQEATVWRLCPKLSHLPAQGWLKPRNWICLGLGPRGWSSDQGQHEQGLGQHSREVQQCCDHAEPDSKTPTHRRRCRTALPCQSRGLVSDQVHTATDNRGSAPQQCPVLDLCKWCPLLTLVGGIADC